MEWRTSAFACLRAVSTVWARRLLLQPARFTQRAAEEKFDLRIQAAQIVIRPSLHRFEQLGIDAKEKRLPLRHGSAEFKVQSAKSKEVQRC